jgi:redox-sensitive bicupin YhaK (pirin superfamily)
MPEVTRHGPPAFEHHPELPQVELGNATATVLVGDGSPARRDTDHFGLDLALRRGATSIALDPAHEHGIVVTAGTIETGGELITPGRLAYLPPGREELALTAAEPARLLLLGGSPFEAKISMFWNFVARTHAEIDEAVEHWQSGHERFGRVASALAPIPSPTPPWR